MTILEIGISIPTLVDRSKKALHSSIAREFHSEGHRDMMKREKSFLPQETDSIIGRLTSREDQS
jgi:hypothetical protein